MCAKGLFIQNTVFCTPVLTSSCIGCKSDKWSELLSMVLSLGRSISEWHCSLGRFAHLLLEAEQSKGSLADHTQTIDRDEREEL